MHDGLRVHGHLDAAWRHVEQSARLNHFQALVHQRGRVDGYDRPHMPSRMVQCLLGRDVDHLIARPTAERTAGCGYDQFGHLAMRAGTQRLPDGGMFGIDRVDLLRTNLRVEQQVTAGHHGFLVRQCKLGAGPQRRNGRLKTNRTGNAVEYHIGTGTGHIHHGFGSGGHFDMCSSRLCQSITQRLHGMLVEHGHA